VGARCPTCAQVKRFALLLKPRELARAIGYGVVVAAIGSAIAMVVPLLGPLFGFAIVGFAVGEVVSVGANRKRVPVLGPIAVACLFLGYELGVVTLFVISGAPLSPGLLVVPILQLRGGLLVVGLLLGALLAWMRVR
jgi:hypothetical protein